MYTEIRSIAKSKISATKKLFEARAISASQSDGPLLVRQLIVYQRRVNAFALIDVDKVDTWRETERKISVPVVRRCFDTSAIILVRCVSRAPVCQRFWAKWCDVAAQSSMCKGLPPSVSSNMDVFDKSIAVGPHLSHEQAYFAPDWPVLRWKNNCGRHPELICKTLAEASTSASLLSSLSRALRSPTILTYQTLEIEAYLQRQLPRYGIQKCWNT